MVSVHTQKMSMQKCIAGNEETQQITFNTILENQTTVYYLDKKLCLVKTINVPTTLKLQLFNCDIMLFIQKYNV